MSVLERMRNGVGLLTMVFFLAFDSSNVVTGLNADGVTLLEFKKGITWDPQNALQGWQSSDATPCLWSGITCIRIQSTMEDRVVGIALPRRALGGTISPKLGDLGYLATLSLHTNNLTGQIPAELFNATALNRVYLSGNNLTGAIPPEIRNLAEQLRVLELRGNRLTTLPHEILSCYRLRRLILSNNNISGTIPIGMGSQFSQLERLDLSVNRFTGTIPDDFGNLTSLLPQAPLNLSNNLLSGAIPPSLAGLQRVPIDVSHNQLSGQIPPDSYFQSQGPPAYVGNGALCGSPLKVDCASSPSPSPSPSSAASDVTAVVGIGTSSSSKRALSKAAIVSIAVGCAIAGFILMATVVVYFVMRKLHISRKSLSQGKGESRGSLRGCLCSWRESATRAMSAEEDDGGDLVHLSGLLSFDLEELLRASAYVLGKSVVGIVYKAVLDEGTVVAVRRLGEGGEQKQKEFIAEAKSIAQVRHPNIVTLHSYSWAVDEKLLVYDYLPNGSLETALHGRSDGSKGALTWEARLRIGRGAAQGIAHIHECSPRKYIHGDIKPSNILLDPFLDARIADFGLRRLLSLSESERDKEHGSDKTDKGRASSVTPDPEFRTSSMSPHTIAPFLTGVYQAPEAVNAKRPSQKSDVYSFGVVLLELLTGRSPFKQLAAGQHNLVSWMRFALQQKKAFSEIFDPVLLTDDDDQSKMIETLQVALACIAVNPDSRPKMKQVAEFFQQLSKS